MKIRNKEMTEEEVNIDFLNSTERMMIEAKNLSEQNRLAEDSSFPTFRSNHIL
jgi:hypothetical protein